MDIDLRKQLFMAIRDIPYRIDRYELDSSCVAKTKLLGELLTRIGLLCEVWKCKVAWVNTEIPNNLLAIAPRVTFSHIFLKVFIPETKRWVIVDPTWDRGFAGIFSVNEWDGLENTQLAYAGTDFKYVTKPSEFRYRNFDPNDLFTKKLNNWYQSLRRNV